MRSSLAGARLFGPAQTMSVYTEQEFFPLGHVRVEAVRKQGARVDAGAARPRGVSNERFASPPSTRHKNRCRSSTCFSARRILSGLRRPCARPRARSARSVLLDCYQRLCTVRSTCTNSAATGSAAGLSGSRWLCAGRARVTFIPVAPGLDGGARAQINTALPRPEGPFAFATTGRLSTPEARSRFLNGTPACTRSAATAGYTNTCARSLRASVSLRHRS